MANDTLPEAPLSPSEVEIAEWPVLHRKHTLSSDRTGEEWEACIECEYVWPCPTIKLLAERQAREARIGELENELRSPFQQQLQRLRTPSFHEDHCDAAAKLAEVEARIGELEEQIAQAWRQISVEIENANMGWARAEAAEAQLAAALRGVEKDLTTSPNKS